MHIHGQGGTGQGRTGIVHFRHQERPGIVTFVTFCTHGLPDVVLWPDLTSGKRNRARFHPEEGRERPRYSGLTPRKSTSDESGDSAGVREGESEESGDSARFRLPTDNRAILPDSIQSFCLLVFAHGSSRVRKPALFRQPGPALPPREPHPSPRGPPEPRGVFLLHRHPARPCSPACPCSVCTAGVGRAG